MDESVLLRDIPETLDDIRARSPMLTDLVAAIVGAVSAEMSATHAKLLREVESLGRTIADTRAEIASLSTHELGENPIPSANDELDAVIAHTAASTDTILETCESLDALAANAPPEIAAQLQAATTAIYEACSFQDITGQRIKKVVAALQLIDSKVAGILKMDKPALLQAIPPEPLMNGPQLPANAMGQDAIDQLLADFA